MNRLIASTYLARAALIIVTISMGAGAAGCGVEVGAEYPDSGYDDYPPAAYVTTNEPVYYEGHATYWYGNRWYYRDGNSWRHYDNEPAELRGRRTSAAPRRRTYEPAAPRPVATHRTVNRGAGGHAPPPSRGGGRQGPHR